MWPDEPSQRLNGREALDFHAEGLTIRHSSVKTPLEGLKIRSYDLSSRSLATEMALKDLKFRAEGPASRP